MDLGERVTAGTGGDGAWAREREWAGDGGSGPWLFARTGELDGEDVGGNFATLKAYLQLSIMSGEPAQSTVLAIGGYDDTLSKEDGTWRFVRRTFTMDS